MASAVRKFLNFIRRSEAPRRISARGRGARASNLTPWLPTFQDWDLPNVQEALQLAEGGNMRMMGQISDALVSDGAILGQLSTRFDGMLQLPRAIDGERKEYVAALKREIDDFLPASELGLLGRDGAVQNIIFGEILEDEDTGDLRLVRRNPEFLQFSFADNQWRVQTAHEGLVDVNPGDGRWLLYFPHGGEYPWRYGIWQALAFAYIQRRQAFLNLNAWNNSLAFPIKVLTVANGADDDEAQETFDAINHFGPFPAIRLNDGWKFELEQPSQATPSSLTDAIEAAEREIVLAVSGQSGTTDPGPGFGNVSYFAKMKSELIQFDANTLAHALNTQVIRVWAQRRYSFDGWLNAPKISWDTTPPRDRVADANAANTGATALAGWQKALAGTDKAVDVAAYATACGVPLMDAPKPKAEATKAPLLARVK